MAKLPYRQKKRCEVPFIVAAVFTRAAHTEWIAAWRHNPRCIKLMMSIIRLPVICMLKENSRKKSNRIKRSIRSNAFARLAQAHYSFYIQRSTQLATQSPLDNTENRATDSI